MNALPMHVCRFVRAALLVAGMGLAAIIPALAAQVEDAPHPAHIHSGTCETLGEVVVPLADVAPLGSDSVGPESAIPIKTSTTRIEMPLQAIIDGGHAINIHKSADEIDTYIACGAVGGIIGDDNLVIGLGELNDSGHSGVAVLETDGDATNVTVYLVEAGEAGASAAAQEAAPAATDALAVEIKDFAFNPPSIEIAAGDSIAWTNQDGVPHTATAIDKAILQSGAIAAGNSFTQLFDTPGSYEYYCEFHPNMKGSIVVE